MDYPIEVTLKRPVTVGGKTYEKLVFDEPDLGTTIAMEEASVNTAQTAALLAGMAGVSVGVILKVKESDFFVIRDEVLVPYMAAGDRVGNGKAA